MSLNPDTITRENAIEMLADVPCSACRTVGRYQLFHEINNNGLGIQCSECGKHHPFIKQRVMWLRGADNRRSNDIVAVAKECGAYCYSCGLTFDELDRIGAGLSVHHTQRFAENGETGKKIPVCARCHELMNFMQRMHRQLLDRSS